MEHTYQVKLCLHVTAVTSAEEDENEVDDRIVDAFVEKMRNMADMGELDNDLFDIKMKR